MNNFVISASPHIHSGDSIKRNMYGIVIALIPAFITSVIFFGYSALIVMTTSVIGCYVFEYLIQRLLFHREATLWDGSALITGILLAFNVPSNLPIWIILIGALVAIGVGKMSFGGLGCNIFNPALVGRVFLLISFPAQMTQWPQALGFGQTYVDASTGATPLALVKGAVMTGTPLTTLFSSGKIPTTLDLFFGNMNGSLGEIGAFALLLGFIYMLIRRVITWHIPVFVLGTMFIFGGIMHCVNPEIYPQGLFQILTGGAMLGAIFMATDYVTSPMTTKGAIIYAIGIGILTMVIRLFGAYPEGMSFAILIMNGVTPLINRYCKPRRFM